MLTVGWLQSCTGEGVKKRIEDTEVNIPPGVEHGMLLSIDDYNAIKVVVRSTWQRRNCAVGLLTAVCRLSSRISLSGMACPLPQPPASGQGCDSSPC